MEEITAEIDAKLTELCDSAPIKYKEEPSETVESLIEKYGSWGEHPFHKLEEWQAEVANNDTRRGYWEWVVMCLESDGDGEVILEPDELDTYAATK